MKLSHPAITATAGLVGAALIRSWMSTLDYRVAYYDPSVDPAKSSYSGQKIYVFWHEYILIPIYMRGHCNLTMLLSRHRDAEILSRAAHHLGFEFVRGSTNRGATVALRELFARSRHMTLTITPAGPRGPRRQLAQGPVYLASKLGMPIVTLGLGYNDPWRMPTWDRFALPKPFSRARAVISPAMHIPQDLDRDGVEHYRVEVERMLNRLTLEAEAWATSGTPKLNDEAVRPQHSYYPARRYDRKHEVSAPHMAARHPVLTPAESPGAPCAQNA